MGLERRTNSRYVAKRSWKKKDGSTGKVYHCNRSGTYKPTVDNEKRKRKIKSQGSRKIGQLCPARIDVTEYAPDVSDVVEVNARLTHYGHECQLEHLSLSKEERSFIEGKLAHGYTPEQIIEEIKQSQDGKSKHDRIDLTNNKDLCNIFYSLKRAHETTKKNHLLGLQDHDVELLVQQQSENYKRRRQEVFDEDDEHHLHDDDDDEEEDHDPHHHHHDDDDERTHVHANDVVHVEVVQDTCLPHHMLHQHNQCQQQQQQQQQQQLIMNDPHDDTPTTPKEIMNLCSSLQGCVLTHDLPLDVLSQIQRKINWCIQAVYQHGDKNCANIQQDPHLSEVLEKKVKRGRPRKHEQSTTPEDHPSSAADMMMDGGGGSYQLFGSNLAYDMIGSYVPDEPQGLALNSYYFGDDDEDGVNHQRVSVVGGDDSG